MIMQKLLLLLLLGIHLSNSRSSEEVLSDVELPEDINPEVNY